MATPRRSPEHEFKSAPSPAATAAATSAGEQQPPSRIIDNLSPPLIAMFAVIGIAFLIVVYARLRRRWRRWRRCRHLLRSAATESQLSPPPFPYAAPFPFSSDSYSDHVLSPYGLDDAAIKTLPLSIFSKSKAKQPASTNRDCAVCLFEFEDGEWLRTLPFCSHAFHIECIDVWLRSHPTCPLCRAAISFRSESPFIPMRAARIRPSFDDIMLDHPAAIDPASPISEERGRGFLLKRSYSFGFERSVVAERMVLEIPAAAATVSPAWGIRHQMQQSNHHQHRGFWSKRWASPFGGGGGSARPYYNRRSPFVRRWGFVPLPLSAGGGVAVGSSLAAIGGRRSRSMTSPSAMGMGRVLGFSSSRMRCGDPEALLSPERFNRR